MTRRYFLKAGGWGLAGIGLTGCATRGTKPKAPTVAPRPRLELPPVDVSWERVIRTTVGLRPHRPSGFLLKAEKLDSKIVIHNYGHGGAGISLSWGCGRVAAELATETGERRAAVLGCGAVGLAAARQLQSRGFDVTIYAAAVPPETTSNKALAAFTPTSAVVALDQRTPEWDAQFRQVALVSYEYLQLLVGEDYGISWLYNYSPTDDVRVASGTNRLLPDLREEQVVLEPGEHPFPTQYAIRRPSLRIEPSIYLRAVLRDFLLFGGRVVVRKFQAPAEIVSLVEPVVVNCTGLGARELFGDSDLIPLKGQLTVLVPQPEIHYMTTGSGRNVPELPGGGLHMMPRTDGIILGGTRERDVWTLEPNEDERKRVVEGHIQFFTAMRTNGSQRAAGEAHQLDERVVSIDQHVVVPL